MHRCSAVVRYLCAGIFVSSLVPIALAEEPYAIEWARRVGSNRDDFGTSIAVDSAGNAFLGGYNCCGISTQSAFLTKVDSIGNVAWSRQVVSPSFDTAYSVTIDLSGNAYLTGGTSHIVKPPYNQEDAFLTKYDSMGQLIWLQFLRPESFLGAGAVVDKDFNILVTGLQNNGSGIDAFLAKYDEMGNELWWRDFGTPLHDRATSLATDNFGNTFVAGHTEGSLSQNNLGDFDAFLTKYDTLGNHLWTHQFGTSQKDEAYSVAVDGSGNAYVTGQTWGNLSGMNAGASDAFLAKFDSSGNALWSRQLGSRRDDGGYGVAVDGAGNAFVTGSGAGGFAGQIWSGNAQEYFLASYDVNGNLVWSHHPNINSHSIGKSITLDWAGNVYVGGETIWQFGAGLGGLDGFMVKFAAPVPEPSSLALLALLVPALLCGIWRKR